MNMRARRGPDLVVFLKWVQALAALLSPGLVRADYDCVCSYSVEVKVLPYPDTAANPIGYMYEFDCKKSAAVTGLSADFTAIEFEHKLGYVVMSPEMQNQVCPGSPSATDTLYTSTKAVITSPTSTRATTPTTSSTPSPTTTTSTTTTTTAATTITTTTPTTTTQTTTTPTTTTTTLTTTTQTSTTPTTTTTTPTTTTTTTPTTTTTTQTTTTTTTPTTTPTTTTPITTTIPTTTTPTTTTTTPTTTTTTPTTTTTIPTTTTTTPTTTTTTPTTTTTTPTTTTTTPTTTTTTPTTTTEAIRNVNTNKSWLRYIGVGYDLLHGNPGGMARTTGGQDPGLRLDKRVFQLTTTASAGDSTARELEFTMNGRCVYNGTAFVINDGKSYQNELLYHTAFPNDHPQTILRDAFTLNSEFQQVRQEVEGHVYKIYRDKLNWCHQGTVRYNDQMANSPDIAISANFAMDVCNLPATYTASKYFTFIDHWGTSVIMGMNVGTFRVARYVTSNQQLIEHVQGLTQSGRILYPTGSYKGYGSSITVNVTELSSMGDTGSFGTLNRTQSVGSGTNLAPMQLMLYPLTEAFSAKYWKTMLSKGSNACQSMTSSKLNILSKNLKTALDHYSSYRRGKDGIRSFKALTDHAIQFPLTWPDGNYTLQKAAEGCPTGKVSWKTGYRKYGTEYHNRFSPNIQHYLSGTFVSNQILTNFCTKIQSSLHTTVYNREWPGGTYCVMRYGGSCPTNFDQGYIYWDDNSGNYNSISGTLPDGSYSSYGSNTRIYYCCRNNVAASKEIFMPREKPFVLLRYGTTCQSVHGMLVKEVFVRWDDEDSNNQDTAGGAHPSDGGDDKNHLLYFCYYHEHQAGTAPPIIG